MTSLGTDFETHAIWQGYAENPAAKDFVARKARTIAMSKARGSCHKTSNNQPYSRVWKSLGDSIPKLYCVALLGLGHARKVSLRILASKKGMICIQSNGHLHKKPSSKRWKRENSLVVRLLPGSHERLASRNPCILCQNYGGACTTF